MSQEPGPDEARRPDPAEALAALVAPVEGRVRRASALAAAANLLWLVQAAAVAAALGGLLAPPASGPGALSPLLAAAVFLAAAALRAGLSARAEAMLFRAGDDTIDRLRRTLLAREALVGPGPLGAGATAALAAEKLERLLPWLTRYGPARARVMVVPLAILVLALWQSWAVGLVFLMTGPLIPVFMALVGWAAQEASERQMTEIGDLSELAVDRVGALPDIRLLGAREALIENLASRAEALRQATMAVLRVAFLSSTVLELFAAIGVAMVAVYLGFSMLGAIHFGSWGAPLTPAGVIFLLMLTPEFYQPLRDLAAAWHDRADARAVAAELARWQAHAPEPPLGRARPAPPLPGPLSAQTRGVVLARGTARIRLPDFRLEAGETLALTGPSGAGKTSALMALAGLLGPEEGEILVCGRQLDDETADAWRARLGWLPQTPHFLDRTLRENVALGDPDADIAQALERARVADVVAALPQGADTVLGERGAGLSGGEARRVTLARAIQAKPDLLLADEPTADLDAETARMVTESLLELARSGTALIVATHDMALAGRLGREVRLAPPEGAEVPQAPPEAPEEERA